MWNRRCWIPRNGTDHVTFAWELPFQICAKFYTQLIFSPTVSNAKAVHVASHRSFYVFIYYSQGCPGRTKKEPNQAPDPKLAFYSERWGQRCIIHILVHNTEAKLFSEVSPVWKLLPLSLPTPKTYCIFTRATSIRPTAPPPFFWYKLCKTFVLRTFLPPQTKKK